MDRPPSSYKLEIKPDGYHFTPMNMEEKTTDRCKNALSYYPPELDESRPWTIEDEERTGFRDLSKVPAAYMHYNKGGQEWSWHHAQYVSPQQMVASGHLPNLLWIQEYIHRPRFQELSRSAIKSLSGHVQKRGTVYDVTASTERTHAPGSIHISKTASTQDPEVEELIRRLSEVTTAVIREHVPSLSSGEHLRRWAASAVPTMGHHDNLWSTHVQVNCSELKTPLATAIKHKGKPHFDKNDDTLIPSLILFLGNHPSNYYPGRMTQYATRTFFPAHTYGAAIMTGRLPHNTTGRGYYPADFPVEQRYTSLPDAVVPTRPADLPFGGRTVISYASQLSHRLEKISFLSASFYEDSALIAFGTMRNMQEWRMRICIRNNIGHINPSPEYWCKQFSWIENGQRHEPRLWIAKLCFEWAGKTIPDYAAAHQAVLNASCGIHIPTIKTEAEQAAAKKANDDRKAWRESQGIQRGTKIVKSQQVKLRCKHIGARGQCKVTVLPERYLGVAYCGQHIKQYQNSLESNV